MPARLDHLRTFVAVMRAGSFTAASQLIGISQPAVTNQMQALERHLGYVLFARQGRRVSPTSRAHSLMTEVSSPVDALEAIVDKDEPSPDRPRIVHLGGPAEYVTERIVPLLPRLAHGLHVDFRVSFDLADTLLQGLNSGLFDIVISSVFPRRRGVAIMPLVDEEFVLVSSPMWQQRLPDPAHLTADDLHDVPIVAYSDKLEIIRRYWRTVFFRPPSGLHVAATIPHLKAIAAAVAADMGVSVLPRYLIETELREGTLVELLTPEVAPLNTLYVTTQEGFLHRDPVIRMLKDAFLHDAQSVSTMR